MRSPLRDPQMLHFRPRSPKPMKKRSSPLSEAGHLLVEAKRTRRSGPPADLSVWWLLCAIENSG